MATGEEFIPNAAEGAAQTPSEAQPQLPVAGEHEQQIGAMAMSLEERSRRAAEAEANAQEVMSESTRLYLEERRIAQFRASMASWSVEAGVPVPVDTLAVEETSYCLGTAPGDYSHDSRVYLRATAKFTVDGIEFIAESSNGSDFNVRMVGSMTRIKKLSDIARTLDMLKESRNIPAKPPRRKSLWSTLFD